MRNSSLDEHEELLFQVLLASKLHALLLFQVFHGGERRIQLSQGKNRRELNIKIPAGIMNGQSIRLSGQGSPGFNGGKNGDL